MARLAAQLLAGAIVVPSRAVTAVSGHCLIRIAGSNDARAQGDLLPCQSIGIAASVPALVAGAHDDRDRAQRRRSIEYALPEHGVLAHELPLVFAQGAGLLEDRIGDSYLPDIMQFGGTG